MKRRDRKQVFQQQGQQQHPASGGSPPENDQQQPEKSDPKEKVNDDTSELAAVASLISKIKRAKGKDSEDFKRIRENVNFAAGIQWPGQKKMQDVRYIVNIVNRIVQSKTAQLYAKNPTAEFQRRPRLDYQIFDGRLETLMPIVQAASMVGPQGLPPQAMATLMDFSNGVMLKKMIDKVGKTLEILFQTSMDEIDDDNADFLTQAKQAVRRAVTTGVAYCLVSFVRESDTAVTSSGPASTIANRAAKAEEMLKELNSGKIDETKPSFQGLKDLLSSLAHDVAGSIQNPDTNERLIFDFIPATGIITDPKCKNLKHFIGAKWIAIEITMDVDDVKAIFDVDPDFSPQKSAQYMAGEKPTNWISKPQNAGAADKTKNCTVWRVLNKSNRTECYVCDGYKKYLKAPEVLSPPVRGFWPIATLSFNDVETEDGAEASKYPPSDVQLMRDAQKELNRSRNQLKKHRKGNSPKWIVAKGTLTTGDKEAIMDSDTNGVIELEGVLPGTKMNEVIQPVPQMPIEPLVYDSTTEQQDIQMSTGGGGMLPPQRGKRGPTATAATLEAQEDMSITQSNVEDLDAFLTDIARIGGELWLQEGSEDVVKKKVGPGAVWPTTPTTREDFINQIFLRTKAASSGRPNQAVEIRNWQILGPMLMQMGANPQSLVRETIRRLGDNLDPEMFFPLQAPQPNNQVAAGGQHQPSQQQEHEPGRTGPPQQARPGPGQNTAATPQRNAMVQRN